MQKVRVPINSFQYGEVSGSLLMRSDSPVYAASAQSLENMIVMSEGAVKKRYGLKHIYDYSLVYDPEHPSQSHLFKFVFSDDEQYVISVEHQKVRCFILNNDGSISLASTITLDTNSDPLPFDRDYLAEYTYAQYGDVMFICHPLFMPRMLIRTGLTSFEVTPFSFDQRYDGKKTYQPYSKFQASGVTLDPSATTGTVTLTTSEPHWTADHVGTIVRYSESEIEITGYTSSTVVTGTVVDTLSARLSILNPLRTSDGSTTVEVTQIAHGFAGGETVVISNASSVGGINVGNINGTRTVLGIIDENTWTFTAGGAASSAEDGGGYVTVSSHAPTADWDEQAFSAARGYPAAVVFHENRLCYAGTIAQPDSLWMSSLGSFFNFDVGDAADTDAISIVAATGTVNEIRYLISNRDLQIFGAWGELYVPSYLNQPITPTNTQIRLQTPYGCNFVQPVSLDGATIFVQRGGTVVREYLYTDREDAYTATAISSLASHLIYSPKCMTVSHGAFGQAESYAFLSNGNGEIALFNSNRAEKRASWSKLTVSGKFCSVLGVGTRAFANVYDADGNLHLCEFAAETGLDFYITEDVVSNYITVGAPYAEGDVVSVVTEDGLQYIGDRTVSVVSGVNKISMTGYTGTYHIGRKFTAQVITNPIDAIMQGGPQTGDVRGVSTVVLDLRSTRSVKVNNRPTQIDSTYNGKKEFRLSGYSRDPQITISQNDPLPLQVNGLIAELLV